MGLMVMAVCGWRFGDTLECEIGLEDWTRI